MKGGTSKVVRLIREDDGSSNLGDTQRTQIAMSTMKGMVSASGNMAAGFVRKIQTPLTFKGK